VNHDRQTDRQTDRQITQLGEASKLYNVATNKGRVIRQTNSGKEGEGDSSSSMSLSSILSYIAKYMSHVPHHRVMAIRYVRTQIYG